MFKTHTRKNLPETVKPLCKKFKRMSLEPKENAPCDQNQPENDEKGDIEEQNQEKPVHVNEKGTKAEKKLVVFFSRRKGAKRGRNVNFHMKGKKSEKAKEVKGVGKGEKLKQLV